MAKPTPAMRQYHKIKKANPDCIVLFQLGDFYEAFFEDAKTIAKELDIVLTSRKRKEGKIPMAGIPVHAIDSYMPKLVEKGYKVAIAAQTQDASEAKGVVERDVIRIVTPGTLDKETKDKSLKHRYIAAIASDGKKNTRFAMSFADSSTGTFKVTKAIDLNQLEEVISTIEPKEVVLADDFDLGWLGGEISQIHVSRLDEYSFDAEIAKSRLEEHFKTDQLKGFGLDKTDDLAISASGALLQYLENTQKSSLDHISSIKVHNLTEGLILDPTTVRNLELVEPLSFQSGISLLSVIDRTNTPMGGRLLREWLLNPLTEVEKINQRLNAVEFFYDNAGNCENVGNLLSEIPDISRIIGKLGLKSIRPPHLPSLALAVAKTTEIIDQIGSLKPGLKDKPARIAELERIIKKHSKNVIDFVREIEKAIVEEPAAVLHTGKIIKKGYDDDLDELKEAAEKGKTWIKNLEKKEIKRTKVQSLKVRYNKVFGYYIEVSKANLDKVPDDYIRKQTLVNAERFITPKLKEMEAKVLGAEERMVNLEDSLFENLVEKCREYISDFQVIADCVGKIDVLFGFSVVAKNLGFVKPTVDESDVIEIKKGRHPVVESISQESGEDFVDNDTEMDCEEKQVVILTGPNMSGKSTYIRQVALICVLAQSGSFVPAHSARIGAVDRIFARVGASDNLAQGESTFMVEMLEAANILHNATPNSLVILDEVGRGTSTYDGMSLAWAIVEYLHEKIQCKTLFATHYHELTKLEQLLKRVKNYHVLAKDDGEKVIFLRKVKKGRADKSYGVHVAKLAGVPGPVIERAHKILTDFESRQEKATQLNLPLEFSQPAKTKDNFEGQASDLNEKLEEIDINNTTPAEAIKLLEDLQSLL